MKASELLRSAWVSAEGDISVDPGYYRRRLETVCPVAVYAGIGMPRKLRRVSIRIPLAILGSEDLAHSTRGYDVTQEAPSTDYEGDAFVHVVEAVGPLPKDLFLIFCSDILDHVGRGDSPASVVSILRSRFGHWRRFFQSRPDEGLSREEHIGLFSELEFMERCLSNELKPKRIVEAWSGPLGSNQDFLFGSIAVECKATTSNDPDVIRIANIRQLDGAGLDFLCLDHTVYDFRKNSGRTLSDLVQTLRRLLGEDVTALTEFEDRLLFVGYVEPGGGAFEEYGFATRSHADYKINGDFPRLLESGLPLGISDVAYTVHLSVAAHHKLEADVIISELKRSTSNA